MKIHNSKSSLESTLLPFKKKKNSIDKLYRMLLISHNNKRIASEKEENNRIHIARVNEQIRIEPIVNIMNTQVRRSARISCRKNNLK